MAISAMAAPTIATGPKVKPASVTANPVLAKLP